ncbi:MAG: DUF1648 domain-containing protein [Calditrichaeota bacterium]|nr:DUF1648 domain-containing protein [Calditrichota bacterium]
MKKTTFFQVTLWIFVFVQLVLVWKYYPLLPEQMAIHFDALGRADSWASKAVFCGINLGLLVFVAGLFHLMTYLLPRLPEELINLPNKKYWLAPERKADTLKMMIHYLLMVGNLTMLFLFGLFYLVLQTNFYRTFRLGREFWFLFGLYLALVALKTIQLIIHFSRKHPDFSSGIK